ncbi:hypothetical protein G9A89_021374 [Geosiphon pyriformis]|nr:hypothetical protein G9A89_021374 [Geosiphon pyriformis]
MKKIVKASGSEGGFKTVASRKKKKRGVLEEGIDNKGVAAEALGTRSWGSETGDTMESESIDMEEECLVKETSVDYDDNSTLIGGNPDQTPKGLHVKTKKVLGKPLGVINYDTVDAEDNVLDDSLLLLSSLPVKPSVQVPVRKSFALDIDLVAVAGKFSQKKVDFVRKIFSGVNGFGRVSTPSKFGGIIWVSFTSEKAMMAAVQLANDYGVVVNTNLKCPINNYTNWAIVLKEIPVGTSIEAVRAAISEFGFIKSIKMQLANLLAAEWSILIGKDAVCVAQADIDKQTWNAKDEFRALLYMPLMDTNAHDFWDFIGLIGGKTCVIECSSDSFIQAMTNTSVIKGVAPLSAQDQFCLAKIYEKKSALGKTWASVVGNPLLIVFFGDSAQSGSISYDKSLLTVNGELEDRLKNIESSLVSLTGQIGELAKKLDLFMPAVSQPSPGWEDIVMEVGLGDATSDKTAAILGSTASPKIVKLENMLEDLSALVISLSAHLDGLALAGGAFPLPLSQ